MFDGNWIRTVVVLLLDRHFYKGGFYIRRAFTKCRDAWVVQIGIVRITEMTELFACPKEI